MTACCSQSNPYQDVYKRQEYDGETRTLDMHIRTLRQKLGEEGGACIKTVRGVGYRMVR